MLLTATLVSCSEKEDDFIGGWKSIAPLNVASDIYGADSATEDIELGFTVPVQGADGNVSMTGHFNIVRPLPSDTTAGPSPKATFTATASCPGTWTYDVDDDDDILLMFDHNKIAVKIDNDKISLSGTDSIPALKLETFRREWVREIENSFHATLTRFSVIEDVETSKDGKTMSFELHDPKAKIRFVRTM